MTSIVIKDGWFHQILGQPVQNDGFIFIPLLGDLGELEIVSYRRDRAIPTFPLSNYVKKESPTILKKFQWLFEQPVNAHWVRARIPAVFGSNILFSPPAPDYKYGLVEQMFVACTPDLSEQWIAYPFICEDYNLCTGLWFNPDESLTEMYDRIAKAFWGLLLHEPEHVAPFSAGYLHYNELGDEEWHHITFKQGQFSIEIIDPTLSW